jgi:ankyrin repeat protein
VLGLGEDGPTIQPQHQHWYEFARLLLEAGADPNDNQGLYNRMQYPDDEHLKLLLQYGLGKGEGGPWFKRFLQQWPCANGGYACSPADLLAYQFRYAIGVDWLDRVKLFVEHGADVKGLSISQKDCTPEMADYLVAQGAKVIPYTPSPAEEFIAACQRADAARARELLANDPSLLDDKGVLTWAAVDARADSLRLLVELGLDVNNSSCRSAGPAALPGVSLLWWAAHTGRLDAVKLLVELGADVNARDPEFDSTPLEAASWKDRPQVVEYLVQFAPICDAVRFGGLERVRALLREAPECVHVRDDDGSTPLHYPHWNTQHGEEIIELLLAHGADINAKNNAGRTPVDQMLQNGRPDLAEVLRRHGGNSA